MDVNPFLESSFLGTVAWWTRGACFGYESQVQHINHATRCNRWAGSRGPGTAHVLWPRGSLVRWRRGLSLTSTAPQGSPRAERARGQAPRPQQPSEPTLRLSRATHSQGSVHVAGRPRAPQDTSALSPVLKAGPPRPRGDLTQAQRARVRVSPVPEAGSFLSSFVLQLPRPHLALGPHRVPARGSERWPAARETGFQATSLSCVACSTGALVGTRHPVKCAGSHICRGPGVLLPGKIPGLGLTLSSQLL